MQVPSGVLQQIEKLRRAFLWAGKQTTSPSKCLVAWQTVCTTKDLGGLGIKDLGTHNVFLLINSFTTCTVQTLRLGLNGSDNELTWQL